MTHFTSLVAMLWITGNDKLPKSVVSIGTLRLKIWPVTIPLSNKFGSLRIKKDGMDRHRSFLGYPWIALWDNFFSHLKQAKKILDGANEGPRDKRKSMKAPPIGPVVSAANVCPDQSTAESPGVFPAQNSGRLKGQLWLQPSSLLS